VPQHAQGRHRTEPACDFLCNEVALIGGGCAHNPRSHVQIPGEGVPKALFERGVKTAKTELIDDESADDVPFRSVLFPPDATAEELLVDEQRNRTRRFGILVTILSVRLDNVRKQVFIRYGGATGARVNSSVAASALCMSELNKFDIHDSEEAC
jgi:hypothetical protein